MRTRRISRSPPVGSTMHGRRPASRWTRRKLSPRRLWRVRQDQNRRSRGTVPRRPSGTRRLVQAPVRSRRPRRLQPAGPAPASGRPPAHTTVVRVLPVMVSSAMVEMCRPWGGAHTGPSPTRLDDAQLLQPFRFHPGCRAARDLVQSSIELLGFVLPRCEDNAGPVRRHGVAQAS